MNNMKNYQYKIDDWVTVVDSPQLKSWLRWKEVIGYTFKIRSDEQSLQNFNRGVESCIDERNHYEINYTKDSIRLATREEILKAGGEPKLEDYEVY